jgi:glycosyltransferase involved in cell wall biosynthesis
MIKIDIICSEMRFLNGANRVTEKLILGRPIFEENNINLRMLYTNDEIVECKSYISKLGMWDASYLRERKVVTLLKKLPIYRSYPIQKSRQDKVISQSRIAVERYINKDNRADCLIFQDVFSAYHFLTLDKGHSEKVIVITHADTDPLEQLLINRPELKGRDAEKNIRGIVEYVMKNADKVVSICNSSQKYIRDNYNVDSICIHNGIEDVVSKSEKINNGCLNIVILGSVIYRKGQDILIDALSSLSPEEKDRIRLHIIGDGNEYELIANKIYDLKLENSCKMYGLMTDVSEILSTMDVMILPSRADTVPIAIIEGLRAGLPVFATPLGEMPFMISGCGELIEATVESVSDLLRCLISGKYNLEYLSSQARKKYESEFSLEKMIRKYASCVNEI